MKGVLKIKYLKKYIHVVMIAFAFLFININNVNANSINILKDKIENNTNEIHKFNDGLFQNVNSYPYVNNDEVEYTFDELQSINQVILYTSEALDSHSRGRLLFYNGNKSVREMLTSTSGFEKIGHNKYLYKYSVPLFDKFVYRAGHVEPYITEIQFMKKNIPNISNLNYDLDTNNILFNYDLPTDENFSHLELHQDGLLLADNITTNLFEVYNLEYDTKYNFTFYTVDKDGIKSTGISREIALSSDPNLIPSNNIFGLTHTVSDTTVSFNYSLPMDNNFSHLKIYRNNELINDNYQLSEFIDTVLEPETEYNYRFVSVNKMDISNAGYAITIKTMEENDTVPPAVPIGLNTTNMNSGIVLSWNTNTESDLQGYNVYMNGIKMNNKPISNSIYNITNLKNGIEYSFTVSAVDTFGNESEQSISVIGVPDVDSLPIFKLDTHLSSIGSSVENWFSEIWLIVAFATAIPLSFAIAGRVKGLFIA